MSMKEYVRDSRFTLGILAGKPFQVLIQVTNRCNMRCSFCDFWPNGAHPREELTVADYEKLSADLAKAGTFLISIEGGEPFVRPDLIEVVRALSKHHVTVLYTNGWHVTADNARALWAAGLAQVGVSIDFPDAARHDAKRDLKGATERAWKAIDHFRQSAPHGERQVHVMSVLMEENQDDLEALLQQSRDRKVGHCMTLLSTGGFRRAHDAPDKLPRQGMTVKLVDLWKRYPHFRVFRDYLGSMDAFLDGGSALPDCRAGTQSFNIDHVGNVSPCIEKIDQTVGNVRQSPLPALLAKLRDQNAGHNCQQCWTLCRGFNQALGQGGSVNGWLDLGGRMRSH